MDEVQTLVHTCPESVLSDLMGEEKRTDGDHRGGTILTSRMTYPTPRLSSYYYHGVRTYGEKMNFYLKGCWVGRRINLISASSAG
jgi:hypothetical protein